MCYLIFKFHYFIKMLNNIFIISICNNRNVCCWIIFTCEMRSNFFFLTYKNILHWLKPEIDSYGAWKSYSEWSPTSHTLINHASYRKIHTLSNKEKKKKNIESVIFIFLLYVCSCNTAKIAHCSWMYVRTIVLKWFNFKQ